MSKSTNDLYDDNDSNNLRRHQRLRQLLSDCRFIPWPIFCFVDSTRLLLLIVARWHIQSNKQVIDMYLNNEKRNSFRKIKR